MHAFSDSELEQYKAEAREKWGGTDAYSEHARKTKDYSQDKWHQLSAEMDEIFAEFALCMKSGAQPGDAEPQRLVKRLQEHITQSYYRCTDEILAGLGQLYTADERFARSIDRHADGAARFVSEAIEIYCA